MAWNEKNSINNGNQFESDVDGQFTADNLNKIVENIFFLKEAVDNAEQGGITPSGTIDITSNGSYDVTNYATANVKVQGGSNVTLVDKVITENGVHRPETESIAWNEVTVMVDKLSSINALTEGFIDRGAIVTYLEISATNGGDIKRVNVETGEVITSTSVGFSSSQISNNEFIYAVGDTLKVVDSMNRFEAEAMAVYIYGDPGMLPYYKYNAAPKSGSGGSGEFEWKNGADLGGYTLKVSDNYEAWTLLNQYAQGSDQLIFFNNWTYTRLVITDQGSTMGNVLMESGGDEGESDEWKALSGKQLSYYSTTNETVTFPSPAIISFGVSGISENDFIEVCKKLFIVTK